MTLRPYSKVSAFGYNGYLELIIIQKIREDAYICTEEKDTLTLLILFKKAEKNKWYIVCNLGKFKCTSEFYQVFIKETENMKSTRPDLNLAIFNKTFVHPSFDSYERLKRDLLSPYINIKTNNLVEVFDEIIAVSGDSTDGDNPFAYDMLKYASMSLKRMLYNRNLNTQFNVMDEFLRTYPDVEYIREQLVFSLNTTMEERYYLRIYSYKGDNVINSYIRNNEVLTQGTIDYINQNDEVFPINVHNANYKTMELFVKEFYRILKSLFSRAPPNNREFMVYRGSKTKDHFAGTVDNIYSDKGFVSTSIDLDVAMKFSQDKYVSFIHIPVGARVIFNCIYTVFPEELEVVLNDSTYYLVTKEFQPLQYISENMSYVESDINKYKFLIETNELIVLNN
ncbi:MAG: hypothetical protein Solivirus1_31 [Solivirus sp.]|uniref:ADP ribosyltransferase domain-containing protein n=1 Tax=Solivirus sp. TaxID=2487772 RepID=A0A3G5AH01_9VIRU|nr:MAG: hypothetical protein Solivirus1_31 [Solivirus sp.]